MRMNFFFFSIFLFEPMFVKKGLSAHLISVLYTLYFYKNYIILYEPCDS